MNDNNKCQQIFMLTMENLRCIMQECFALMKEETPAPKASASVVNDECELLSPAQVMERCKVTRSTLSRWRKSEYLVPIKKGLKHNFYKVSDLEALGL